MTAKPQIEIATSEQRAGGPVFLLVYLLLGIAFASYSQGPKCSPGFAFRRCFASSLSACTALLARPSLVQPVDCAHSQGCSEIRFRRTLLDSKKETGQRRALCSRRHNLRTGMGLDRRLPRASVFARRQWRLRHDCGYPQRSAGHLDLRIVATEIALLGLRPLWRPAELAFECTNACGDAGATTDRRSCAWREVLCDRPGSAFPPNSRRASRQTQKQVSVSGCAVRSECRFDLLAQSSIDTGGVDPERGMDASHFQ